MLQFSVSRLRPYCIRNTSLEACCYITFDRLCDTIQLNMVSDDDMEELMAARNVRPRDEDDEEDDDAVDIVMFFYLLRYSRLRRP